MDPFSACYNPAAVALHWECTDGDISDVGNGWCDFENNNEGCGFDGGDCCECTSTDDGFSFPSLLCVDPSSPCYDPAAVALQLNCTDGYIRDIGDGHCDYDNNNEECLYDGGDCCECTHTDNGSFPSSFRCVDPSAACYNSVAVALKSNCTDGYIADVGNGRCDAENNNEACLYDGGDCCPCTCTDWLPKDCGINGFSCVEPGVDDLKHYICVELPPIHNSCAAGFQREWVVENTAQARALAEAVRCSSGSFNVSWKGRVVVEETIFVGDETILNVTGGDADAAIIGDGVTTLFTAVNASLYLSNINISNGYGTYGGAIAASRSKLTIDRVNFDSNNATRGGGALSLSQGAIVLFGKEVAFMNNTAHGGGAVYLTGGSKASWTENVTFSENDAYSGKGGALYVTDSSSAVWTAASHFVNNSAEYGGALHLEDHSTAIWSATSRFLGNTAEEDGGALYFSDGIKAAWTATSFFYANSADNGGALYVSNGGTAEWSAASFFSANDARWSGGALYLSGDSNAHWRAKSYFFANSAFLAGPWR